MKERQEKRRNVGIKVKKRGIKSKVEGMIGRIGVEIRIEGIQKIKGGSEERGRMTVRLGSEGEKRRTMEKKKDLRR